MGLFIFCLLDLPYPHWPPNPPCAFYPPFICPSIPLTDIAASFPIITRLIWCMPHPLLFYPQDHGRNIHVFYWSSFRNFVVCLMGLVLTLTFTSSWDTSRFKCILVTRLIVVFFMWPHWVPSLLMNLFLRVPLDFCSYPSTLLKNIWSSS